MLYLQFIFEVLHAKVFGSRWIHYITKCLHGGKSATTVNGQPERWIIYKRGVREGDPPSALLFVLVADVLTKMINLGASVGVIEETGTPGI